MTNDLSRRHFLARAALVAPSLAGLVACTDPGIMDPGKPPKGGGRGSYGPLEPSVDHPEISIPSGFRAKLLSTSGDVMSDGNVTPNAFDGMGAFSVGGKRVRLVRNHEIRNGFSDPNRTVIGPNAYDSFAPSGNSTLEVEVRPDGSVELKKHFISLSGTFVNCAGGETPWGSWISCEETVAGTNVGWERNHGYNFEIPASADGPVDPVPLKAMGRFVHEAICVDPDTGIVYQTEDRNPSGFYRFIPDVPKKLAMGGKLEMLAIKGSPNYDTRRGQIVGDILDVEWVPIAEPDTDEPSISSGFVFDQGAALGGASFARLEGCWWGDGGAYFNATSGGDAGAGQVFKYVPKGRNRGQLILVFESPSFEVLNSPDNICISPRGGIVICEDGRGTNFVRGITDDGEVFDFVRNNANDSEWAGACFSPQGRTLFVNIQGSTNSASSTLGKTYAIWGPWESGPL
jgi:secreted PhoX family phosphatase